MDSRLRDDHEAREREMEKPRAKESSGEREGCQKREVVLEARCFRFFEHVAGDAAVGDRGFDKLVARDIGSQAIGRFLRPLGTRASRCPSWPVSPGGGLLFLALAGG